MKVDLFKAVATNFFYWWHNQPGSNTQQGFDDWWEQHGSALVGMRTPAAKWRENGEPDPFEGQHYDGERANLCKGNLTDDDLANTVYLQPDIGNLTAAKERIRWLSRALVGAVERTKGLELDLGLAEIAHRQKSELLESCEQALGERDEQIGILRSFLRSAINDGGASRNLRDCARDLLNKE